MQMYMNKVCARDVIFICVSRLLSLYVRFFDH